MNTNDYSCFSKLESLLLFSRVNLRILVLLSLADAVELEVRVKRRAKKR